MVRRTVPYGVTQICLKKWRVYIGHLKVYVKPYLRSIMEYQAYFYSELPRGYDENTCVLHCIARLLKR